MRLFFFSIAIFFILPLAVLAAGVETVRPALPGGTLLPGSQTALFVLEARDGRAFASTTTAWLQEHFASNLANTFIGWGAAIAVVMLIIGAYQYLAAAGESDKISTAHKTITWSLAGLVVMMFSFALVQIVVNVDVDGDRLVVCRSPEVLDALAASGGNVDAAGGLLAAHCSTFVIGERACTTDYVRDLVRAYPDDAPERLAVTCTEMSLRAVLARGISDL